MAKPERTRTATSPSRHIYPIPRRCEARSKKKSQELRSKAFCDARQPGQAVRSAHVRARSWVKRVPPGKALERLILRINWCSAGVPVRRCPGLGLGAHALSLRIPISLGTFTKWTLSPSPPLPPSHDAVGRATRGLGNSAKRS